MILKFRAWDKKRKRMISHGELFNMDCSNEYPFLALMQDLYSYDWDIEMIYSTGRMDIEGVEIFGGDLVINSTGRLCVVEWHSSPNFVGWDLKPVSGEGGPTSEYRLWDDLKVVGNKYEHTKEM